MTARIRFEPDGIEAEVPIETTIRHAAEGVGALKSATKSEIV